MSAIDPVKLQALDLAISLIGDAKGWTTAMVLEAAEAFAGFLRDAEQDKLDAARNASKSRWWR